MQILLNGLTIILGTLIGLVFRKYLRREYQACFTPITAAVTAAIGIGMVVKGGSYVVVILSMMAGFLLGCALQLESRLTRLTDALARRLPGAQGGPEAQSCFTSAFMLTVCSVAGLTGAMTARLTGDFSLLQTKAVLDGMICVFFALTAGPVILLLCVPTLAVLFLVYFGTGLLAASISEAMIANFCLCGGIVLLLNAARMLRDDKFPILNMLPALLLVFVFSIWIP